MTADKQSFKTALQSLAHNNVSSSTQICSYMIEYAQRLFEEADTTDLIYEVIKNQSSMAIVINTGLKIVAALKKKDINLLRSIEKEIESASKAATDSAVNFLSGAKNIATISFSQSVLDVITGINPQNVYLSVSHPANEGERLAIELKNRNINPVLLEDSGYSLIMQQIDAVVVGADAIFDNSFINKTGTLSLALLSQYFSKPFYVVGCICKYIDKDAKKFFRIEEKPQEEISSVNCKRINRYFEEIPNRFANKIFVR